MHGRIWKKICRTISAWYSYAERKAFLLGPWFRKSLRKTALSLSELAPAFSVTTERKGIVSYNVITAVIVERRLEDAKNLPRSRYSAGKKTTVFVKKILKTIFLAFVYIHAVFILSTSLAINCYRWMTPVSTTLALYRKYSSKFKVLPPIPATYKTLPKYIRSMLIAVEDYKFYEHNGFDLEGIKRAIEINKRFKKPLYGGSTISMQTARTLFLIPEKSYLRKYLEAIITVELEFFLSKDRILELYFSLAEWGKGIFGLEQAARYYYKVKVRMLGRDEAARLIAVLSSPILNTPNNLQKNRLLAQRYSFLVVRYVN